MKLFALALVAASLPAQIRQPAANIRFGSALPSTCTANIGQVFFLTSASAGANVYGCTATNTWTVQGAVSGGVGGASNLTTVGAVPYVGASGVLNQDASNFFWDATNHRLGIGTNAPSVALHLLATGTGVQQNVETSANAGALIKFRTNSSDRGYVGHNTASGGSFGLFNSSGTSLLAVTSGSVGIGTSNTSPTGTLDIVDRTGGSGATTVRVGSDGTNTSATTTQLVVQAGATDGSTAYLVTGKTNEGVPYWTFSGPSLNVRNDGALGWTAGSNAQASRDASLSRISAGIVAVGTGAAGSVAGTLQAKSVAIISPTVPATAADACTAGAISWDASYIYVCTASGAWKRSAIATW